MTDTKRCPACKKDLPRTTGPSGHWTVSKSRGDGLEGLCKPCKREANGRIRDKARSKHADPLAFDIDVDERIHPTSGPLLSAAPILPPPDDFEALRRAVGPGLDFGAVCDRLRLTPMECRNLIIRAEAAGAPIRVDYNRVSYRPDEPVADPLAFDIDAYVDARDAARLALEQRLRELGFEDPTPEQRNTNFGAADPTLPLARPAPKAPPTVAQVVEASRDRRVAAELRRQVEDLARENERLTEQLEGALHLRDPLPPVRFVAREYTRSEAIPLLMATDWHVEETVDPEKVNGLNKYNPDIARARAERYFRNAAHLVKRDARDSEIRTCVLYLGGDFFTGSIHDELMESNALGPAPAARLAQSLLAGGVRYLLEHLPGVKLEIVCVDGNHGRMTEKTRISTRTDNSLESFMYHSLAAQFEGEGRIRWTIAQGEFVYLNLFDNFVIRFMHGDQFKYGGGVGGITIPLRKKISAWDRARPAKLTAFGHWHQRMDGGDFLGNGSLIGYSAYAQRIGASPEEPQQQYALIHSRNGGTKAGVAPIWVTD